jgi:hypothetical protein
MFQKASGGMITYQMTTTRPLNTRSALIRFAASLDALVKSVIRSFSRAELTLYGA